MPLPPHRLVRGIFLSMHGRKGIDSHSTAWYDVYSLAKYIC